MHHGHMNRAFQNATICTAMAFVFAVASIYAAQTDPAPRPNIIFILADDLGWSDIGCYGSEIRTPHLDRMAAQGMRFTQIHNTSKCFPSRACLLTGVYAQQCGMAKQGRRILNAVTLGEALRGAGYRTLAVGKHHGTENLYNRGFDHYRGLRDGACNYFNPGERRPGEGEPAQKRHWRTFCFDSYLISPFTPAEKDFYTTDYFTNWAIELLDKYKDDDKPFFLYLAYNAPHDPLHAWPEDIAKYKGVYDAGYEPIRNARYEKQKRIGLIDEKTFPLSKPVHRPWDSLSESQRKDQARRMQVYAAMIDRLDQNIGRLLTWLEERGELADTLILFASDNGASAENVAIGEGEIGALTRWSSLQRDWANVANTPYRFWKNDSHEGGICTPFIAHWPRVVAPGAITNYVGHFVDVMPTLLDAAGGTYPSEYDGRKILPAQGRSLMPVLRSEKGERKGPLFWQWQRGRAVYEDGWKVVSMSQRSWELYNLREDRTETDNLAEEEPERVKKMSAMYDEWEAQCQEDSKINEDAAQSAAR
jgi:arylsulfatase